MSYSDLFDGEEHWLGLDCVPGWRKPYMQVTDSVDLDPQPPKGNLESPLTNVVTTPVSLPKETAWGVEDGWSAFAVMMQELGSLLSPGGENYLSAEQHVVRDEKTWAVKSTHYKVIWKGDPDLVEGI